MTAPALPFEPEKYDDLPISVFVYEPVLRPDGVRDFRILYGNGIFIRDWQRIYKNSAWRGALLRESTLMDEYSLSMLERFLTEAPHAFSTYIPMVHLHLYFEPIATLPSPVMGFFMTNLTDYQAKEAKIHFLRNIAQMKNNAVLMRQHDGGRLEAVYVSDAWAKMMECGVEEALHMVDGMGFFRVTHPEDRPFVRSMLKRRVTVDGSADLTIQQITARGRQIWCSVHLSTTLTSTISTAPTPT